MDIICRECGYVIEDDDETMTDCGVLIHFSCLTKHRDHCTESVCQGADDKLMANKILFASEVITTAVESGIHHWAAVRCYKWEYVDLDGERNWAEAEVRAWAEPGVKPGPWKHITPDLVITTLGKIAAARPLFMEGQARKDILAAWAVLDSGDIDSTLADQILQVTCFDEVRYG